MIVAENVRYFRKRLGLSQEALGFKCKMPDVYISKLERGILNVGIDNLEKIAKALGVTPSQLLEPEAEKKLIISEFCGTQHKFMKSRAKHA
jgi:transcriptional regulator with XRE-family HTH domain